MKLTNKHNLPETFINVIKRPTYNKGDVHISCTELLNSPRIVQLKHKHWDELEQDASEMVWALFGSAVHGILEHGKDDHHIVEERLFVDFHGWKMSGAIDLQEVNKDGIAIRDYKVTGAWAVQNQKLEWDWQLNVYAWMVEKVKGANVSDLAIIAIIRDWSARDAETKEGYPQAPVVTIPIPLWSFEEREKFVISKLEEHSAALFAKETESELPLCTPEQMWEKPAVWAVIKEGGVRAKSLHASQEEAELSCPKGYVVQHRPGERTRCKSFCQVSKFCTQYQSFLESQNESDA